MTKRTTTTLLAAAAALSLAAAGAVSAQPRGPRGGPGDGDGPGLMHRAARFLELTEDQKTRLAELEEQGRPERERIREASRAAHERLRAALEAENPDPTSVGEAAIEIHSLREQQRTSRESFENAFESLLTPDQLRKWEMMQASQAAGGGPFRRHGRGPGRR